MAFSVPPKEVAAALAVVSVFFLFFGYMFWRISRRSAANPEHVEITLHDLTRRRDLRRNRIKSDRMHKWDSLPTTSEADLAERIRGDGVADSEEESTDPLECAICIMEYEEDDQIRILPCKHHFHKDCVDEWFAASKMTGACPQCRAIPIEFNSNVGTSREATVPSPAAVNAGGDNGPDEGALSSVAAEEPVVGSQLVSQLEHTAM
jgi:hypothetical protein